MSDSMNPDKVRELAPFAFGIPRGDRWALISPRRIATECSPKHVQSVLEDAQRTIATMLAAMREARVYLHPNLVADMNRQRRMADLLDRAITAGGGVKQIDREDENGGAEAPGGA